MNAVEPVGSWTVTDEAGLLACYDATFERVYRYAARLVGTRAAAEDLVQETYVRLVRAARGGAVDRIGIGWLITTTRRLAIDRGRAAASERARLTLVAARPDHREVTPDDDAAALLAGLPARERAALVLRYVDGMSVPEVADLLGSSVRATESLLQRAKQRLRRHPPGEGALR